MEVHHPVLSGRVRFAGATLACAKTRSWGFRDGVFAADNQIRDRSSPKARSVGRSRGRGVERLQGGEPAEKQGEHGQVARDANSVSPSP
jgi:hypothetical protein